MEWLLMLAAGAAGTCALAWWLQERLIFFPQPIASTKHLPARAVPLDIVAEDGAHLRGWLARGTADPAPAVIFFGGNAEEASWILAEPRWPREWTIVAVNYRGYGASDGKPGERALTADGVAIHDAVVQRADVDATRIVLFGRSLGTAVAVHVAAMRPVAGVVLASPFDSLAAVGRQHYPWLPVALLLRHRFDAASLATRNTMPLLAIVGDADSIVAPARSRALFDAWAGPKTWQAIHGADHNDLGSFDEFWNGVARFLAAR
jgi:pimeloyl-ACP methyl ester carboxylesterase